MNYVGRKIKAFQVPDEVPPLSEWLPEWVYEVLNKEGLFIEPLIDTDDIERAILVTRDKNDGNNIRHFIRPGSWIASIEGKILNVFSDDTFKLIYKPLE